jgi:outer membrane receptor for ferrienterochelin and colicins
MLLFKLIGLIAVSFSLCFAQTAELMGKVVDEQGIPVADANIVIKGTVLGAATNDAGEFKITNLPSGSFILSISVIGYEPKELTLDIKKDEPINLGTIKLQVFPLQIEPIVVTASRTEKALQEVSMSVSTVSKTDLEARNTTTLDEALKYISGVNLNATQINIRGSSGYSRGVGSRVMMLIDGIPYLTGDTQEPIYESFPINQIERIEVVKGAGSALYGSSAIAGVINVITKGISDQPQLGVKLYGGFYSLPYYPEWKWTEDRKYLSGMNLNYSDKKGKVGYRIATSFDNDDSFRKNDWRKRYRIGGKVGIDVSPFQHISIAANYMLQKRGNFLYWQGLDNALVPPPDQQDDRLKSQRYFFSTSYRHVLSNDNYYSIKAIWFHNRFEDNIEGAPGITGNESSSDFLNAEIQFNKIIKTHFLTAGLTGSFNTVNSNIFGDQNAQGAAFFLQDEIKWSRDIFTTFGARLDYYKLNTVGTDIQANPKAGVVYKPWPGGALRGSFGLGFRAPSIAEVFTSTDASGLSVIPNPNLKPEHSRSFELGYNQFLSRNVFVDLSLFHNRFWNLIEGIILEDPPPGIEGIPIQFNNITDARILGLEVNFNWNSILNLFDYRLGYTYVDSKDLNLNQYLTFRPRHLFYFNSLFHYKLLQLGIDYRFIKRYDRIDENLKIIVPDAEERVSAHIVDLHLQMNMSVKKQIIHATLHINNLFQYHYIDLVGSIAKTRNYVFTLSTTL